MQGKGLVFVTGDRLGDQLTALLEEAGCQVMAAAPRLRAVVSSVIGVDTIDMDAANEMGLIVGHGAMPENYMGVSEATVMLIAALLLDLPGKARLLRTNVPRPAQMQARMVRGKTIGLIGMGRTARGVVERLAGWGVTLQSCDP